MKHNNSVVRIYNFDLDECISEFKNSFNDITKSKNSQGIHTFLFSSYNDQKVTTELVYCSIYEKTVIFYVSQAAIQLNIGYRKAEPTDGDESEDNMEEPEFEILGGEVLPIGGNTFDLMANEAKSDVYYIGRYNKNTNIMELSRNLISSNMYELNSLRLSDELRLSILNHTHPDVSHIGTHVIDGNYYDIYTIPVNSSLKINQIDGIGDDDNNRDVELMIVNSHPDILYLGDCCNMNGFFYSMYTLNKSEELNNAMNLIENELIDTNNLIIDDSELVDTSIDFFNDRINQYKSDINIAIEKEEPPMNIDENPFANGFFDNMNGDKRQTKPLNAPRRLGE